MTTDLEDADTLTAELLMAPGVDTPDDLLDQLLGRPAWQDRAACRDFETAYFFPRNAKDSDAAVRVCILCAVRADCLDYALSQANLQGVWGGSTEAERHRLRKILRVSAA